MTTETTGKHAPDSECWRACTLLSCGRSSSVFSCVTAGDEGHREGDPNELAREAKANKKRVLKVFYDEKIAEREIANATRLRRLYECEQEEDASAARHTLVTCTHVLRDADIIALIDASALREMMQHLARKRIKMRVPPTLVAYECVGDATLRDVFRVTPWDLPTVLRHVADQVLPTLEMLTRAGLAHEDLYPQNVVLDTRADTRGGPGRMYIVDYAKLVHENELRERYSAETAGSTLSGTEARSLLKSCNAVAFAWLANALIKHARAHHPLRGGDCRLFDAFERIIAAHRKRTEDLRSRPGEDGSDTVSFADVRTALEAYFEHEHA